MTINRKFTVFEDSRLTKNKLRTLNDSIPQGSIPATLLFNLYVHNIPETKSQKCQFSDEPASLQIQG